MLAFAFWLRAHERSTPSLSVSLFSLSISELSKTYRSIILSFIPLHFSPPGKCVVCDSYVRPATLVRVCDECNYGSFQGRCVICGGAFCYACLPSLARAYFGFLKSYACFEFTLLKFIIYIRVHFIF